MKKYRPWIYYGLIVGAIGLAVYLLSGCATKPPTALEQRWFDISTNRIPAIVLQTNVVTVTNLVGVPIFQTNVVSATNYSEEYTYKPGAGAQSIRETGTAVGNIFGVGGLVGTAIGGLFSLWGVMRSKKSYVTAANLSQTIETMREFIRQLPDGQTMDNELINWMQLHQAEAGVLNQVLTLLEKEVNTQDAKVAADHIRAVLVSLNTPIVVSKTNSNPV
jgi:hypothetical protein